MVRQRRWFSSMYFAPCIIQFHYILCCIFEAGMLQIESFLHNLGILMYRTELCRFSGAKIYPGKGIRFIRADSQVSTLARWIHMCRTKANLFLINFFGKLYQVFLFSNSKCKRYFHNRLKPAKLTWTAMYRKQHKKV